MSRGARLSVSVARHDERSDGDGVGPQVLVAEDLRQEDVRSGSGLWQQMALSALRR